MARIGYARVSTPDQDLDVQQARLKAEGCTIVRSEKVSGGSRVGRTELATVIEFLRPGDELVVTRLDRLGHMTKTGDCWSNDKAEICFTIDAAAAPDESVASDTEDDIALEIAGDQADNPIPATSSSSNASSFRGIQLGMTEQQIRAALPAGFTVSPRDNKIWGKFFAQTFLFGKSPNHEIFGSLFTLNENDEVCGEFAFSGAIVDKMRLSDCFFGIDTSISLEDFAKQIIANYDIADGMTYDGSVSAGNKSTTRYSEYTGVRAATSERFTAALSESSGSPHLIKLTVEKIPNINFN